MPTAAASGPLTVSIYGVTSNGVPFTVEGTPTIAQLSPATGTIASTVQILGSGFGATQSNSTVDFNGTTATVTSWADTEVDVTVPVNATTGPVGVTVANLNGQSNPFVIGSTVQLTDSAGNVSTYTAVMQGGIWHASISQGSGCSSCTMRGTNEWDYDADGNMLDAIDGLNHKITYSYDGNSNVLSQTQALDSNTNVVWSYTYNTLGEVLTATDPLGNVTTNTYDTLGNLLTVLPLPGGPSSKMGLFSFAAR